MKILVIYPYFGTPSGSWSTRMYELSKRWCSYGDEVEIITAPYEKSDIKISGFIEKRIVDGISLVIINSADDNRKPIFHRAMKSLLFSTVASFLVLFKRYDILLASSGPITVGIPMLIAKVLRKKKIVFEVRDLWPEGAVQMGKIRNKGLIWLARLFEKICYVKADRIVAASIGMKDGVESVIGSNSKICVYPNASDLNLFNVPRTLPETYIPELSGKEIIIYTGSLGEMDECETVIKAMKFFREVNLALIFIGEGTEKENLIHLAKGTNNGNIYFLGLLPKTEVVKWYSIAAASLVGFKNFPVLATSSPNKMFDSFAASVPVIQNTQGWIKTLLSENGGGYNVDYESVDSYVRVLQKILNDKKELEFNRSVAYDLALNRFNRDIIAHDYYKTLHSVV